MKALALIMLAALLTPTVAMGQLTYVSRVVYVDSLGTSTAPNSTNHYFASREKPIPHKRSVELTDSMVITSREKKFVATVWDFQGEFSEDMLRCIKMAIDAWESKIEISTPIPIYFLIDEDIDPSLEIHTVVDYYGSNGYAYPESQYIQSHINSSRSAGEIRINPYIDWNASWANESSSYGHDNMVTALQRHIAHILGFGTSLQYSDGTVRFSNRNSRSHFDNLVYNGQQSLYALPPRPSNATIVNFLKNRLVLKLPNKSYTLYSSTTEYTPYRTANYFSLSNIEDIMNYPYADRTKLLTISNNCLEVMEAIGWQAKPFGVTISGTNMDAIGYGSMYLPHTFNAINADGDTANNAIWRYELYNKVSGNYEIQDTFQGCIFTITPQDKGEDYIDIFHSQQGRVSYQVPNGDTYTFDVYLETRPLLTSYEISNIADLPGSNGYCTFDIHISSLGATSGHIDVINGANTKRYNLGDYNENTITGIKIYKSTYTFVDIQLDNEYGHTNKSYYISEKLNSARTIAHTTDLGLKGKQCTQSFKVYDISGTRIQNVKCVSELPKGIYLVSKEEEKTCKKIVIK